MSRQRSPCVRSRPTLRSMSMEAEPPIDLPSREDLLTTLAERRRDFLSFLERRVGHREVAEDVLQEAFARSLDKVPLGSEESAVAWFYRVLRNAVCRCVARLSETLKDEYALALRRIDVDGVSVVDYAAEAGITANNAGVR